MYSSLSPFMHSSLIGSLYLALSYFLFILDWTRRQIRNKCLALNDVSVWFDAKSADFLINLQLVCNVNLFFQKDCILSQMSFCQCQDMVPPKDPYIKVRVLEDIGNVLLSDQSANLARHAILFLRRTDAEQYISQAIFTLMSWYSFYKNLPKVLI